MASTQDSNHDLEPGGSRSPRRPRLGWWLAILVGLLAINFWAGSRAMEGESRVRVPYSPFFLEQVREGNVTEITSEGTAIQGTFARPDSYDGSEPTTRFETEIPTFADTEALSRLLEREGVVENAGPLDTGGSLWARLLIGFGPTLLFVGLLFWLARRAGSVQNALGSFGRSSARRYQPSGDRVTFADVAGIDEAKQELTEVVDFLRNPDKYVRLGGRIPHGVLLSGPPGTGKTLLARALAGEANAPFFSMAASEFVEAIVGVGAARVRDLFKQAKAEASAIIFIDELDAVGRSRTSAVAGFSGGNDEREQTLNQILTEMDGFDSSTKVIVRRRDEPARSARSGPAPAGPIRPPRHRAATRPQRPSADPRSAHPRGAARRRRGPGRDRRLDAGNGRRRSGQPRQRGHVARGAPQPHPGHPRRLHRRPRKDRPRHRTQGADDRRPTVAAPPTTKAVMRSSACSPTAPTRCARSPSSRAASPSGSPSPPPTPTATTTPTANCGHESTSRWEEEPPRRSSSATSPPAPNPTSSSSPRSPARWSAAGE